MSETSTEERDQINQSIGFEIEMAQGKLARIRRKVAGKLEGGEDLDWNVLENLVDSQAIANIWTQVTDQLSRWKDVPANAPERADLVEAAHMVRVKAIRDVFSYRSARSTNGMSNEEERAKHEARLDFIQRTMLIYPDDSPLQKLGR